MAIFSAMRTGSWKTIVITLLMLICNVVVLILPALWNRYPLVDSDTGTYLFSGHEKFIPVDRPIFYGLFVRYISMSYSLWFVIVIQACIVLSAIWGFCKYVLQHDHKRTLLLTTTIVIALSLCTGISWFVSQIMPDWYSPVIFLSALILLFGKKLPWYLVIYFGAHLIYGSISHLSNLAVLTGFIICLWLLFVLNTLLPTFKIPFKRIALLSALTCCAWLTVMSVNYRIGGYFKMSCCSNIVLMGRLAESPYLEEYLIEKCPERNFEICNYIDLVKDIEVAADFNWIWWASPVYQGGCLDDGWQSCWKSKNKEYGHVIQDIFREPRYRIKFTRFIFHQSFAQLKDFGISGLSPLLEGAPVIYNIETYYPYEENAYRSSVQSGRNIHLGVINTVQVISVILSAVLLLILITWLMLRKKHQPLIFYSVLLAVYLLGNAFVCAAFSTVVGRYQGRLVWLIPMFLICLLADKNISGLLFKRKSSVV